MTDHETLVDFLREYDAARRAVAAEARVQAGARPGQVVHHLDGSAWNNDPGNLRIVDPRENARGEDRRARKGSEE